MAHQVFISYATEDKQIADAVCEALEKEGITCWYAPRNIPYGLKYEDAIIDAILPCRLVVLIFSSHSNASEHVAREIHNACGDGLKITIVPFRLENLDYNKTLRYYLSSLQWYDASTPPVESHLQPLVKYVKERLPPDDDGGKDDDKDGDKDDHPDVRRLLKAIVTTSLGATLLIFVAAWVGLFNLFNLDDWVERKFIAYMDGRVEKRFSDNALRLVLAEESQQGEVPSGDPAKIHRRYHAELVDALAGAHARVVAFDIDFEGDTEWDEQFAEAIRNAQAGGTRVVVGVGGVESGKPKVDLPEKLRDPLASSWGNTEAGLRSGADGPVLKMQLAQKSAAADAAAAEIPVTPSFALQVVGQAQDQPAAPFFNPDEGAINLRLGGAGGQQVKSIPVDDDLNITLDLADDASLKNITRSYQNVYANRSSDMGEFKDKIVLVGYRKGDLHSISDTAKRYGAEIQANAVSNILQDVYIRYLSPAYNLLVILLMGAAGALVQTRLGRRVQYKLVIDPKIIKTQIVIPVTLLVISALYFVIAVSVYKHSRLVLEMPYHVAALFAFYWVVGAAVKKASLPVIRKKEVVA